MGRCSSVPRAPSTTSARISSEASGRFHQDMNGSRTRVGNSLTDSQAATSNTTSAASSTPL